MSEAPPPQQFANYPRGQSAAHYGTPEKLRALHEGDSGLNQAFVLNVVLAMGQSYFVRRANSFEEVLGIYAAMIILMAAVTYPLNKKIGIGKDWPPSSSIIASVFLGLSSILCCGAIGTIVMQQITSTEIKKYGVKRSLFRYRKQDIEAAIQKMQQPTVPPTV